MHFDQLHTFLEIVRLKSFSKATETRYRTQSALSVQMRQLERELKTPLFERSGGGVSLTPAGEIFADYARQILDLAFQAQSAVEALDRIPHGQLVISANEATCIYTLPEVFARYKSLYPDVQLHVARAPRQKILEAVIGNAADLGLAQLPVGDARLEAIDVYADEIRLIVPRRHVLAGKKSISADELAKFPLLLPKRGTTRERLDVWLRAVENRVQISMELDSTEMTKRFILSGLGLSFLPVSNCREEFESGQLRSVALAPKPMKRRLGLVYRKDKTLTLAASEFIQVAVENLRDRLSVESDNCSNP